MSFWKRFASRSFDWPLCVTMLLLIALGLTAIYSVDLSRGSALVYFRKQVISLAVGIVIFVIASQAQYTVYRSYAKFFYLLSVVLLVAVLLVGSSIRGHRSWFNFGGFSIQPVEAAKLGIIFMLAYIVYHFGRRFERPLFFFGTGIVTLLPVGLIILQPDLGSAVIVGSIWFGLMLLVGARKRYLAGLILAGLAVAALGWFYFLKPYQKDRITTFIHPEQDARGTGYNITQATIAVGAGKMFGRGIGFGSQSQLRFLPEAQTDFIFSVIGEELGFAGVVALLALFCVLLWRLIVIVRKTNDDFVAVAISGIAILFFVQFFENIGSNIGLLPITGVPLPFVSYGGSSLIVNMFLVGMAESMVTKKY